MRVMLMVLARHLHAGTAPRQRYQGLIRRSMEHVRSVRRNPYPLVSVLPGVRNRRHGPAPSSQSVRSCERLLPAQPDDPCRAQVLGQRHPFQNDSVPLSANLSTSRRGNGNGVNEQLPSGLRAKSATALAVPVKLPIASSNCPVPPVTSQVNCCVPVNRQLCGLTEPDNRAPPVLTTCIVPLRKTRSS